jgi:MoxR-like ATPase
MKHIKLFESWTEGETLQYSPTSDIQTVSPEEAKTLIARAIVRKSEGTRTKPIMLAGRPGSGKTEVIAQAAAGAGIKPIILDLSTMDLEDFVGVPSLSTKEIPNVQPGEPGVMSGTMESEIPSWFPLEGPGILVLDDLNRAETRVMNAALSLAYSGRLQGAELPTGFLAIATISSYDNEGLLTSALADKFTIYQLA